MGQLEGGGRGERKRGKEEGKEGRKKKRVTLHVGRLTSILFSDSCVISRESPPITCLLTLEI